MRESCVLESSKVMTSRLSWCVLNFTIPSMFLRIDPILARPPQVMQPGTFICTVFSAAKTIFSGNGIPFRKISINTATTTAILFMIISPRAASGPAGF